MGVSGHWSGMKPIYANLVGALALTFATTACVPAPEPAPAPSPTPAARPSPAPAPVVRGPEYENYLDAPQTPGDWSYSRGSSETFAIFRSPDASPLAILRCDLRARRVGLGRYDNASSNRTMRIRTETLSRLVDLRPVESTRPLLASDFGSVDPMLDAIAITKGRFAMETEGLPTLYLPAWPEISRVIEDCR